jgi:predicted HicB family RNase H-like nuclease
MKYKGYIGEFTFNETLDLFQGKISNIQHPITFKGKSIESLTHDFKDAINDYLDWCKKSDHDPEEPCSKKKLKKIHLL